MRVSIITPSLNQREFLVRTSQSILAQQAETDLEWLILDGGSTDGTLEFLGSLSDPRVRWRSEPDRGQADAINKGLAVATGEIVAWLNSDDLYLPGALPRIVAAFAENPRAQWLIGRCQIIDRDDRVIRPAIARYKDRSLRRYTYRALLRENFISQPAVFWRRQFGAQFGLLDESLHWTMDYDLWLRMGARSDPLVLDEVLAQFRLHERSKSGRVDRRQFDEGHRVALRYLGNDRLSRLVHRINIEKIMLAYRVLRFLGR